MNTKQAERNMLRQEAGFEETDHFVVNDDVELRKLIEQAQIFAETIIQSKFSPTELQSFSKIICQFVTLYWEMGIQTWLTTRWRGVPVFKPPTDLWIYQELIWTLRPDVIIETGTCAGGSALFLVDILGIMGLETKVITIDIVDVGLSDEFKIRLGKNSRYYRDLIFLLGSSVDEKIVNIVKQKINPLDRVMVILDSDHSYEHVIKELELYAPLVTKGSVLVIEDTGNTPETLQAVKDWYVDHRQEFKQDVMCEKFMLTFNRDGFYERIS